MTTIYKDKEGNEISSPEAKPEELPLKAEEWEWTNGGFTYYAFSNKKTEEKRGITMEDKIELSLFDVYSLIEDLDHCGLTSDKSDELANKIGCWEGDLQCMNDKINKFRNIIREKWKEKFTGSLPHLGK